VTLSHAGLVGGVESLLVPIAEEEGFFAAHGVDAETRRGSIEQGQIGLFGSPAALQALTRGVDLKVVAAFSTGRVSSRLVAKSSIQSARDLRGRILGANGVGAGAWTMTSLALERMGLARERDNITIESTGDLKATEQALREGRIDAALLSSLQSESLAAEGYRRSWT
jgi:ABC-type nitrate/sulfonate/bicarbonate transport system substrate-binding protein